MTEQLQLRRGPASQVSTFTGAQGECVVDTTNNRLVVNDGATAGGWPAAKLGEVITNTRTAVSDAAYAALASDRLIAYTALTAARAVALPAASAYPTGTQLTVIDESGLCSATLTITLNRAGSDTINGATSTVVSAAYGSVSLESNGSNAWAIVSADSATTNPVFSPQGRLTLTSATPVLTSAVSAATSVVYALYLGNWIPLWNGARFVATLFTELSNVLANSSSGNAGPAAATSSSVYDLFVWNNSGAVTLTRGPAWTNATTRSAGTALTRANGLLVNNASITNGPAAGFGTYVGTVATDSTGATVTFNPGSSAAGGGAATVNLWNQFNRIRAALLVQDSTTSHTYTSATVRSFDNSATNRISFVIGVAEDAVEAIFEAVLTPAGAGGAGYISVGLDSTTAKASSSATGIAAGPTTLAADMVARYLGYPGIGAHFLQALEAGDGANANTFFGAPYMGLSSVLPY